MKLYTTEVLDENSNELLAVLNWTCDDPSMFYDAAPRRGDNDPKKLKRGNKKPKLKIFPKQNQRGL
jgi:hypothetical protein